MISIRQSIIIDYLIELKPKLSERLEKEMKVINMDDLQVTTMI